MLSQLTEFFESKPSDKNKEMHRLFKDLPETEKIIDDYSCALAKEILIQGRMYVSQNWLCFYSNIFMIENKLIIPFAHVTALTKERTALVIPNAITITANNAKYGFSSFVARDIVHNILMLIWQNSRSSSPLIAIELFTSVRKAWGVHIPQANSEEEIWGSWKKYKQSTSSQRELELSTSVESPTEEIKAGQISVQKSPDIIPISDSASNLLIDQTYHTPEEKSISSEDLNFPDRISTTSGDSRQSDIDVSGFYTDLETTYIEKNYSYPCGKLFNLLFMEGQFMDEVMRERKGSECDYGNWEINPLGGKLRQLRYRLALNYSIGPRSCINTEEQVMSPSTQQDIVYLIDVLIRNYSIPYCDNFHVITRYLIVRTGSNETLMKITAKIIFTKISIITPKSFIQRNVLEGLNTYFMLLEAALTNWIKRYPCETIRSASRARRRKRESRAPLQLPLTPNKSEPEDTSTTTTSSPTKPNTNLFPSMVPVTQETSNRGTNTSMPFLENYKYYVMAISVFIFCILFWYLLLGSNSTPQPDPQAFNWPTNQKEWITLVLKQQRAYERNFAAIKEYFAIVQEKLEDTAKTIETLNKVTDGAIMKDAINCMTDPSCSEEELHSITDTQNE
ncbi:GRAM domain-containing protein 1B-like [Oopsacas minuta]|uniref:GRAM domain-containing protein 1B-like n=1 Tax=Oopsacas minuta TaxID=111878 RepID=A0AAV7JU36_9METZ|nr:GRAM domain-containing protein 1B-like [Oopsacas minuta]